MEARRAGTDHAVPRVTAGGRGVHIEIDGAPATAGQLSAIAPAGYGHFTAMQVRNRQVRGLDLHLARLDAANREMFGVALDTAGVVGYTRHALGERTRDASVRVNVCEMPDGPAVGSASPSRPGLKHRRRSARTLRPPSSPGRRASPPSSRPSCCRRLVTTDRSPEPAFTMDAEMAAVLQAALERNGPPPTPQTGDIRPGASRSMRCCRRLGLPSMQSARDIVAARGPSRRTAIW